MREGMKELNIEKEEEKAEVLERAEKEFKEIDKIPVDEDHFCVILEGPEYQEKETLAGYSGKTHELVLELRNKKGETVRTLNEFLPPGDKIRRRYGEDGGGKMYAITKGGIVDIELKSGETLRKGAEDILGILHETGHLQQARDPKYKEYLKKEEFLVRMSHLAPTEEGEREMFKYTAIIERNAWARALRMVRKIRQENGIDLTKYYGWKELEKEIDYNLGTHEKFALKQSKGEIRNMFLKNKKYTETDLEQFKKTTPNPNI